MAYCTTTDVSNRWQATKWWSDVSASGSIDATVVAAMIALADGDINRYVAQQYAVPLALTNAVTAASIRDVAVVLTGWKLASGVNDRDALAAMENEFKEKMAWLKQVADGAVGLLGETLEGATQPSGNPVSVGETIRVTRDSFKGW